MADAKLEALISRLEKVTTNLEGIASRKTGGADAGANENTEIVEAFDNMVLEGKYKEYKSLSEEIGGEVAEQAKLVHNAMQCMRGIIVKASKHKHPSKDTAAVAMHKPLKECIDKVQNFCDGRRASKVFNHLATVKEGIGFVGWVVVAPKPSPYIKEQFDSSLFYGNRVLKEYKGKDDKHVTWMRAYTGIITDCQSYVKDYHTTGLQWNAEGTEFVAGPPPPPAATGAPPPPPPPAVLPPDDAPAKPTPSGDKPDTAALFASINKGGAVTSGLKKVTDDMKTHKNPELRTSSIVKASEKPKATSAPKYGASTVKKPPQTKLDGNKWLVEYHDNNQQLEIHAQPKHAINVFKCTKSTLQVKGKVNTVMIDNCKNFGICVENAISAIEFINCQSVKLQITGSCPTVSIDKCDGCHVFLSKDSLNCEIITAKSSEMNVSVPDSNDEFIERAIPEQFKTKWNTEKKSLETNLTDINS